MTDIPMGAQVFDLAFHPTHCTAYTCLMSGQVKAISYDHSGRYKESFSVSVSQRSCRGISINEDGSNIYVVGKGKALHTLDTLTGKVIQSRTKAHDSPINRVKHLTPWLLSTGDDDGVIKLWDPRKKESIRKHSQHFDYITDFLWLDDKKQLVATSGDGTLSVMDVRSKKTEPFAHSEDQEDELLCIAPIKGSSKAVVGMQTGVLSIFNRSSGWGDCVDRVPGHPQSVDTMCNLPESLPDVDVSSTLLTGSSDGIVRAIQVFPTKLLGVVADHGEWPIEKVVVGEGISCLTLDDSDEPSSPAEKKSDAEENDEEEEQENDGRWWVGSVGHDEILKLTNLRNFFRPGGDEEEHVPAQAASLKSSSDDDDSDSPEPEPTAKKRKQKPEKNPLAVKRKKGKNTVDVEGQFFDEL
ncbi:WD40 repeat-like protein [Hymenopellis radicata]|nr:WD40 repeat-like protein [Hymenopellis radicata]